MGKTYRIVIEGENAEVRTACGVGVRVETERRPEYIAWGCEYKNAARVREKVRGFRRLDGALSLSCSVDVRIAEGGKCVTMKVAVVDIVGEL